MENGQEFLRKMLGFADEDDEGDVRQDWLEERGLEVVDGDEEDDDEENIRSSGRRRNPFIADECEVAKRGREEDDV